MYILKYPRTRHLEGSRLQAGDTADDKPMSELAGHSLVVEEKVDGANCAISFDTTGTLRLQSRGHYLSGGGRERHFALLKTWAAAHAHAFQSVLGNRFVMYGEWLYAKHTVFYDRLPHYFLEFDVFDREAGRFLSTGARLSLLRGLPVMPVPVIHTGKLSSIKQVEALVRPSLYKSPEWRSSLEEAARMSGSRGDMVEKQTEDSDLAEGLYLKLETEGEILDRFKFVRGDFLQTIQEADGHWLDRPILPNRLAGGVDIFAPQLGLEGAYDDPSLL
ncbi:RNA ligase family protein [uncultured Roseibium sp.]|uniref:RNA ligase family protein n=1 Tax=uncultured Roseibium sp. TaxID=1936171 RepID=UPI0032176BED